MWLRPDQRRHSPRRLVYATGVGAVTTLLAMGLAPAASVTFNPYNLTFPQQWTSGQLADAGLPIAESSPMIANLGPGGPSVVVGDREGYLYAYQLATGDRVPGWPAYDGGPGIDSTPSVAALGSSPYDTVFVGTGYAAESKRGGGYEAFSANGAPLWQTGAPNPVYDRANGAS